MKRKLVAFMTMCIVLVLLAGCITFPTPESPSDTLLIIPLETDRNTSFRWFGKVTIEIARAEDQQKVESLKLDPESSYSYVTVTGLPPGRYIINKQVFVYNEGGKRGKPSNPSIPFTLKPGAVTVLDYRFRYSLSQTGSGSSFMVRHGFEPFQGQDRDKLFERLRAKEGFDLWIAPAI